MIDAESMYIISRAFTLEHPHVELHPIRLISVKFDRLNDDAANGGGRES